MGQITVNGKVFNIKGESPTEQEQGAIRQALAPEPQVEQGNPILESIAGGSGRGIAQAIGAPVDLANFALSFIGLGSEEPFGGGRSIQKGFENIGVGVGPDTVLPDKFSGRVAEEIGAATVPFGVVGKLSRGAVSSALANRAPSQAITRRIGEFFRANPKSLAAAEAGSATTAGIGAAIGQQISPDDPFAELAGQLLGGFASPGTLAAEFAPKLAQGVKNTLRPITTSGAEEVASGVIKKAVRGEPAVVAKQLDQPSDFIEGAAITPAGEAGDVGLLSLERAVAQKSSDTADNISEALTQTNQAVTDELNALRGTGRIDDTVASLSERTQRTINALNARSEQAITTANNKLEALGPNATREQANVIARQEIDSALSDARAQEKINWSDVDESLPASIKPAREQFLSIKANRDPDIDDPADIPEYVTRLLGRQKLDDNGRVVNGALSNTENVGRVQKLRSRIMAEATLERAKDAPNRNKVRILNELSDKLLDGLEDSADDSGINAAIAYSRELNQKFTKGTVGKLLGFEKTGEASTAAELTLEKSISKPGPAAAVGFEDITKAAGTEATTDAVNDFLKDRFVRMTTTKGKVAPDKARRFLVENKQILDRNPKLRSQFQSAIDSQQSADDLIKSAKKSIVSIKDRRRTASSILLDAKVGSEVNNVLKSKNPTLAMRQVLRKLKGDKDALAGIKTAFMDELIKASTAGGKDFAGVPIKSGSRMGDFIQKNRSVINNSGLFNKQEVARLNRIERTASAVDRELSGGKDMRDIIDTAPDAITELVASVVGAQLGAKAGGATAGGSIQAAGRGAGFARKLTGKIPIGRVTDVLNEAVLDKKLMAMLLRKETTPNGIAKTRTAIRGFLINTLNIDDQENQ